MNKEVDVKQDLVLIEQFFDVFWLECNLVENMFSVYCCDLMMLVEWLYYCGLLLVSVGSDDLQVLLVEWQFGGYKVISIVCLLSVVCCFFQYLYWEKICLDDFSVLLVLLKLLQWLLKDFSEVQVECLLQVLLVEQLLELCDKVMLEVLYVIGLCVLELVGLMMSDISLWQGVLWVVGKGNKEWLVLLGEEVVLWVENYFEYGCFWLLNGVVLDVLFFSQCVQQMMCQIFWYWIKYYVVLVGIDSEKFFLYVLCYVFVMYLFNYGVDLCVVQMLLGYSDFFIMQIYIYVVIECL